jgi:hypothetical protein
MKRILDRSFRYVPSHATDVRKTFERIRKEREAAEQQPAQTIVQINREKAVRSGPQMPPAGRAVA